MDAMKWFLQDADSSGGMNMNVRQICDVQLSFYLFSRSVFGKQTLIIREKHVACCQAAGAHLNFNLAKGGRQEGRRAVKCEVVKGKSATSPITQR